MSSLQRAKRGAGHLLENRVAALASAVDGAAHHEASQEKAAGHGADEQPDKASEDRDHFGGSSSSGIARFVSIATRTALRRAWSASR